MLVTSGAQVPAGFVLIEIVPAGGAGYSGATESVPVTEAGGAGRESGGAGGECCAVVSGGNGACSGMGNCRFLNNSQPASASNKIKTMAVSHFIQNRDWVKQSGRDSGKHATDYFDPRQTRLPV